MGVVSSDKDELLTGANVMVTYEPMKSSYSTLSRTDGKFYFSNLKSGGPYTILITFSGYEQFVKKNLYLDFNTSGMFHDSANNEVVNFVLLHKSTMLKEIKVALSSERKDIPGIESSINHQQLSSLPTISRNLQDFIRLVPQAKVNGDGLISLAGQNNKFNAFFIDGSDNNDILGVAISGINGGQTNTPPVSIEVLDKINVLQAPYDVQYSNFTGGSINVITKSGSNETRGSVWYYFRNQDMAGKVGGAGLSPFLNQTYGVWIGGPVKENKLFYFLSIENQVESRPRVFDFADYKGNSNLQQVTELSNMLRQDYGYDPGSFLEAKEKLNAVRTLFKLDFNQSVRNKITLTYRFNKADLTSPRQTSGTIIAFQNNGFNVLSRTHAVSFEWNRFFKNDFNNHLLITYTNQKDDRQWLGKPFPQVLISDGPGKIYLGSAGVSQLSLFNGNELTMIDILKFFIHHHNISVGSDLNLCRINDLNVNPYFGFYSYSTLNDFLNSRSSFNYRRSFPLNKISGGDDINVGAKYKTFRLGFFINDEVNVSERLRISGGVRIDGNALPDTYKGDNFFNDTAVKIIEQYYDLNGTRSGKAPRTSWFLSPRIGFTYKIPTSGITIQGGAGFFSGNILNIWVSDMFNSLMGTIDIIPGIRFNPDPYHQPNFDSLGINPELSKGEITIFSKHFKYPSVFRSSLSVEKKLRKRWAVALELLLTRNINEWKVTNVNLLPPQYRTQLPDARYVYLPGVNWKIPLLPDGENPYSAIYLLTNNQSRKGFSYSATMSIEKSIRDKFSIIAAYTFQRSMALFEPYYNASPVSTQWKHNETVNGKNFTTRSVSDMDLGHRVYVNLNYGIGYLKNRMSTSISVFYNGQSGQPFSYVYSKSMINDDGTNSNYDLIYIPDKKELDEMVFIPAVDNNGRSYSPQQQKELLNSYIEQDSYLRKHRGQFAKRNGGRLPFTNIIDLRIQQNFSIRLSGKKTTISVIFDVFNFTNMLNRNWGKSYFLSNDNFALIRFAGYNSINPLIPQYQFIPAGSKPYSLQTSTVPGGSARWISQLGIRVNFN